MNVADSGCKEINAKICDSLALLGIRTLAHADDAVFLASDGADLRLQGNALVRADLYQFLGLLDILLNGIVRAVKHDRGESCLDALVACVIAAVIQVKSHGNGDVQLLKHAVYHAYHSLIACHVLSCTLGYAENHGRIILLCGQKYCLGPLQVVNVELAYRIVACLCFLKHFRC